MLQIVKDADPELLDKLADANEHTAQFMDSTIGMNSGQNEMTYLTITMLRTAAAAQRKLAKNIREGKKIREYSPTDG